MRTLRRFLTAALAVVAATAALAVWTAPTTGAAPTWAPAATAAIHPGVQTVTGGGQCTANFVFYDESNTVYLGQAAHCAGTGGSTETDGCTSGLLPLGTEVEVEGATRPGVVGYSSWLTMQERGETDPDTCAYNDFALVRIDPADAGNVNPSVPFFGGPTGVDTNGTALLEGVYSYGNSSLRFGISQLSPKRGVSVGDSGNGWSHGVYTLTPGIPGDSGSAFVSADGTALGVLSTLAIAPLPASNGVGDLARELDYLNAHSGMTVQLALGTEPFNPNRLF
jgi:hypothetical protein